MVAARAEAHLGHGAFHQAAAGVIQPAMLPHLARSHVGVGIQARAVESIRLSCAGGHNPLPHLARRLAAPRRGQLLVFDARHLHMQIDAIHQRPADPLLVTGDHGAGARADVSRVAVEAAWARVLGRDQHEAGRVGDTARGARDRDLARQTFQRLAQHFDQPLAELRQLVEEEHAAMGQRDLARPGPLSSAHQPGVTDGVVGRAKRPGLDERCLRRQHPGHAVDLGHFQRFVDAHARQNAGQRLGDQRLAGAGRAGHEGVVRPGRADFHGPFDVLLAHDVGKVGRISNLTVVDGIQIDGDRFQRFHPGQVADQFGKATDRIDFQIGDQGGLEGIVGRDKETPDPALAGHGR